MQLVYLCLLFALTAENAAHADYGGDNVSGYFNQVDFEDIEEDVVRSVRAAIVDWGSSFLPDDMREISNQSDAEEAVADDHLERIYKPERIKSSSEEIRHYFNLICMFQEKDLLSAFALRAKPDTVMHICGFNKLLHEIPEVHKKIAKGHPQRVAQFLLKPAHKAFLETFCKQASMPQFIGTILGNERLQSIESAQKRLLSLKDEFVLDFIEHPENRSLRFFYQRLPAFKKYLEIIEEEERTVAQWSTMRQADLAAVIEQSDDAKLIELFCRKSCIKDLIAVASADRQLFDNPTVIQRIAAAPIGTLRVFLLDAQNRKLVGSVLLDLSDEELFSLIGGYEEFHRMIEVQSRIYALGDKRVRAYFQKPQNACLRSIYLKNPRFKDVLEASSTGDVSRHYQREQGPDFDRPHRKSPLRWYRRNYLQCHSGFSKVEKQEVAHTRLSGDVRMGLDQLYQDMHENYPDQGSQRNGIIGDGGLLERYKSGETLGLVFQRELKRLLPLASEYDLAELALELELTDLAASYNGINGRLSDARNWQKVDQRIVDLYHDGDFEDLASRESQFLINQAHAILNRKESAAIAARAIEHYEMGQRNRNLDEKIWQLASKMRSDKKLAYLVDESSSNGVQKLFEYEADVTLRVIAEEVQKYQQAESISAEEHLAYVGQRLRERIERPEFKSLITKRGYGCYEDVQKKLGAIESCVANGSLRKRFGVTVKEFDAIVSAYDFDPRRVIKTYDDPDREKIQHEGIDILKRYLPAPAYAHPIMGDFSQAVFELNEANEKERAFELIDYLKQFTFGMMQEFGSQTIAQGKGMVLGAAIGGGLAQVLGYCAPLSAIASKLSFPYMVASGVYGIYNNWEAFKADLEECKKAILEGRSYDAGRHAIRAGVDFISAGLGCRIMKNTLVRAHKQGLLDETAKAMGKGARDTRTVAIAKEIAIRAPAEGGIESLYNQYLMEPAISIDKGEFLQQAKILKDVPGFLKPSSPFVKIFQGREEPNIKGFLYEIQVAANMKRKGIQILGLGLRRHSKCLLHNKEFDIITADTLIECKSFSWPMRDRVDTLKSLLKQKKIADDLKLKFELHSKNKIPDDWKKELLENGIIFFEESIG